MGKRSASHMILVGNFRRAIGFGKIIKIQCREIDIENVKKLEEIEGNELPRGKPTRYQINF